MNLTKFLLFNEISSIFYSWSIIFIRLNIVLIKMGVKDCTALLTELGQIRLDLDDTEQ